MSTQDTKEEEENDKNNEAYLIILIPSEEKINFQGLDYKAKNMIEAIFFISSSRLVLLFPSHAPLLPQER